MSDQAGNRQRTLVEPHGGLMPEIIRNLTVGEEEYRVSNVRGILDPGKFEGEMPHAVRDYQEVADEEHSFGAPGEGTDAMVYRVGHRYYMSESQGFITEIKAEQYQRLIAEDGILVEDGTWTYYGKPVEGAREAAWRAFDDAGSDPRDSVTWRRLEGDKLETLDDAEINTALAEALAEGLPCAFQAELYCNDDARDLMLAVLDKPDVNVGRLLHGGDSDEFPQPIGEHETDSPEHCARGPRCQCAIALTDGTKIGALIPGQKLTPDGVAYVREKMRERLTEVTRLWGKQFGIEIRKPKMGPSL